MDYFDWEKYINYYDDLKNKIYSKEEAIFHWNNYGINEGRIFFDNYLINNFDWNKYIIYYSDLKHIKSKEDAIEHWYKYGKNEGRIFFEINNMNEFDWIKYIEVYKDNNCINSKNDAINHWLTKGKYENKFFFKISDYNNNKKYNISFIIFTSKYGIYIAEDLKYMLSTLNIFSIIVYEINDELLNDLNNYFIILFPQLVKKFPNKYIIYQLEQVFQSNWIDKTYISNIKSSIITIDYSINNINNLNKFNDKYLSNKIFYNQLPIVDKLVEYSKNIKYDILFYGGVNERRNKIVSELKKKFNILYVDNIYGNDLYELIKESKIILNIHFYKEAILEIPRIHEILRYNKIIISELPISNDLNKNYYNNNIIFIEEIKDDLTNINLLKDIIDYYLNETNYDNYLNKCNNNLFISQLFNNSLYYLEKNIKLLRFI